MRAGTTPPPQTSTAHTPVKTHFAQNFHRWICPSVVTTNLAHMSGMNCYQRVPRARAQVISAVKKKFKICKRGDVMSQLMFHRWIIYVRKLIFCQASSKIMWWAWWLWWSDNSAWWQIQRWTFMPRSAPMNKETSEHIGRLVRSFICPIELKCDLKQHLQFQTSIWTHMFCVQGGGFEFLFRCDFRIIQRWTNFLEEQFKN